MILQLHKPLYGWRSVDDAYDLFLHQDVEDWLIKNRIGHDSYALEERRDFGKGEKTYLIFYLDIWDNKEAMLFKLTWM